MLVAAAAEDLQSYALPSFEYLTARTDREFAALLARRPVAVIIDADLPELDAVAACAASRPHQDVSILVAVTRPEQVPALLKAGCDAVLLKPFAPNLLAGRIGRLVRARAQQPRLPDGTRIVNERRGTNRAWRDVSCPRCAEANAVSFDFVSHRRMWFACLACNQVWVGQRQE
jgi:DNA-binding response OmpR family regulator